MGVYIKGMDMPTNCGDCPYTAYVVREGNTYCRITGTVLARDFEVIDDGYKPEDCPIVPVPPHGDLIDYNFCMENYELMHDDDGNPVYAVRMKDIVNAPTIIPASEEGET